MRHFFVQRLLALVLLASFLFGCVSYQQPSRPQAMEKASEVTVAPQAMAVPQVQQAIVEEEVIEEGGVRRLKGIDLKQVVDVLPADRIPSIDEPKFFSAEEASGWLEDKELVLGLFYKGVARAYPLQILVWHEIVNDVVAGEPMLITYCPLCLTGIAFKRTLNGEAVEFGTSGRLYNSNLVMYDRRTKSLWIQALGQAIAGNEAGKRLELVPIDTTTWGEWRKRFPQTQVLSRDTGHVRSYGNDPYGDYYTTPGVYFPVQEKSAALPEKALVVGLQIERDDKAYPNDEVKKAKLANDELAGKPLLVVWDEAISSAKIFSRGLNGRVLEFELRNGKIFDKQTQSEWNSDGMAQAGSFKGSELQRIPGFFGFWFSWYSFHPRTQIFRAQ